VTKVIPLTIMNLVTPKAGAKHEVLFNKLASEAGLLNKSSCLAPASGATEFTIARVLFSGWFVEHKSDFRSKNHICYNLVTPEDRAKHELLFRG